MKRRGAIGVLVVTSVVGYFTFEGLAVRNAIADVVPEAPTVWLSHKDSTKIILPLNLPSGNNPEAPRVNIGPSNIGRCGYIGLPAESRN